MAIEYQWTGNSPAAKETDREKDAILRFFLDRKIVFPVAEEPEVSVIIPVYNQIFYTRACLHSLAENARGGKTAFEVILADDHSTDETRSIKERCENLRVVVNESGKRGFLPNVNFAAERARGKFLFFLNNDTLILAEDAILDRLVRLFDDPGVGVAGCRLLRADGSPRSCGRIVTSDGMISDLGAPESALNANFETVESDMVEGAAMMVRTDDWKALNGFDEHYGAGYFEECDFCLRIKTQRNRRVVADLRSFVIHFQRKSFSNQQYQPLFHQNGKIFFRRWGAFLREREKGLVPSPGKVLPLLVWSKCYGKGQN